MSLNGGLGQAAETVTNQERLDPTVVNTNALDPKNDGSLVNSLGDVAKGLNGGAKGGAKGKGTHGKGARAPRAARVARAARCSAGFRSGSSTAGPPTGPAPGAYGPNSRTTDGRTESFASRASFSGRPFAGRWVSWSRSPTSG